MNVVSKAWPVDLKTHAQSYEYDAVRFKPLEDLIEQKILRYDPDYGPYLAGHLQRMGQHLENFLLFRGYQPDIARKIGMAFKLHDAGKILQPVSLWALTKEKPSAEKKAERAAHCALGPVVLDAALEELGMPLSDDDLRHLELVRYFMEAHHERLDGKGPMGLSGAELDDVLRMATILDEIDGKIKVDDKTLNIIFSEIADKHEGKFDPILVAACRAYCEKYGHYSAATSPSAPPERLQM